jgi:nitroreductase
MAQAAKASPSQSAAVNPAVQTLMSVMQKRRSVRVYKSGKVSDAQLNTILEAARWAPSGANTQPWEFVVTRDRKKMKRIREIYDNEWRQRKREDPINYKGLKKDYVGDVSVISGEHGQCRATNDAGRGEHESRHGVGFRARRSGAGVKKTLSSARAAEAPVGGADRPCA